MEMSELDKQLQKVKQMSHPNWGKLISRLKKEFDAQITGALGQEGYGDFKFGYMQLLMNIELQGVTNNELARRAKITKQAMSKLVKELVEDGYIRTEAHELDRRSSIIYLTTKGKKLVIVVRSKVQELEKEYHKLLGRQRFEDLKETLAKVLAYHEGQHGCTES